MSATVVKVAPWEKDGKTRYYVTFSDGTEAVSFSGDAASLEIGRALPDGWFLEAPKQEGWKPMLKSPKKSGGGFGGGAAAWRNTKEGAWFEAVARAVNTAVMQSASTDEANTWLDWSITKLTSLAGGNGSPKTAPPVRPAPDSPPSGGGAPRSGGSGATAQAAYGEGAAKQTPAPARTTSENPWEGMEVS